MCAMRCEANISLRPRGRSELGTKVEVKNLNSFHSVKLALEYEIERQAKMLEAGREKSSPKQGRSKRGDKKDGKK